MDLLFTQILHIPTILEEYSLVSFDSKKELRTVVMMTHLFICFLKIRRVTLQDSLVSDLVIYKHSLSFESCVVNK